MSPATARRALACSALVAVLAAAGCGGGGGGGAPGANGRGDPGRAVFTSAGCGSCHALADAGATGTVASDLDRSRPSFDAVLRSVTDGEGVMPAYRGTLRAREIRDVAAYVSAVAGG